MLTLVNNACRGQKNPRILKIEKTVEDRIIKDVKDIFEQEEGNLVGKRSR